MLPFKNRLVKKKDFDRVQKTGQFFSEANIAIKATENGLSETRIGFAVGIKFSPKAVVRNQAKRRLREIFQKKLGEIKKGLDIVVMIRRKEGESVSQEKMRTSVEKVLAVSGLLRIKNN